MASEPQAPVYYDPPTIPFAEQRSELRAEVGQAVGARLDSTPGIWRLGSSPERPLQLYIREKFLSAEECSQLCERIDAGLYPSPLYEKDKYEGVRTSQSCNLDVFFYVDQPYWAEYEPQGGQRTWTAMIYLNEPEGGGATGFSYLDLAVEPKLGRILIWNNMAVDGSPNPWTQHEGQPVAKGVKYIVTKWYRERQFV